MVLWHKADSLRMLPSGPDLVQIAYSTRSPADLDSTKKPNFLGSKILGQQNCPVKVILELHLNYRGRSQGRI